MTRKPGRFGKVPMGSICGKCTLESPNIIVEPVCSSQRQLWSIVWCVECGVKAMLNVSVNENVLELYEWNSKAPVARLWIRDWTGWDG